VTHLDVAPVPQSGTACALTLPIANLRPFTTTKGVATVNRPVIDRGLFPLIKTHGQERAERGYQLAGLRWSTKVRSGQEGA
jgi:hypothetical protein